MEPFWASACNARPNNVGEASLEDPEHLHSNVSGGSPLCRHRSGVGVAACLDHGIAMQRGVELAVPGP